MSLIDRDLLSSRHEMLPIRYAAVIYRRSMQDTVTNSEKVSDVSVKKFKRTEEPDWKSIDLTQTVSLSRTREIRLSAESLGTWEPREHDIIHLIEMDVGNSAPTPLDEWWHIVSVDSKNADTRFVCLCTKTESLESPA